MLNGNVEAGFLSGLDDFFDYFHGVCINVLFTASGADFGRDVSDHHDSRAFVDAHGCGAWL